MRRGMFAALALLSMLLLSAPALGEMLIETEAQGDGVNQIVRFAAVAADGAQAEGGTAQIRSAAPEPGGEAQMEQETLLLQVNSLLEMRFAQSRAAQLYGNVQAAGDGRSVLHQTPSVYSDGRVASLAIVWEGMQPDGTQACRPYSLALDLTTGEEIPFDALFDDPDAAAGAMEAIIERDFLEEMNTYVEVYDLLPMPRDCFSFDETGLTVYYPDDRYRTFQGRSAEVTFYWYEIAAFIGEGSPVYALSRTEAADAAAIAGAQGYFGEYRLLGLNEPLGQAMDAYALSDEPDYTRDSILYTIEDAGMRGLSVEIPKYAETAPEETPISAVRHSRISWHGLTTGKTTRGEVAALLGEPEKSILYDEDAAADMLLDPGESLLYTMEHFVLEAHMDADGVLACLILHAAMPERLY